MGSITQFDFFTDVEDFITTSIDSFCVDFFYPYNGIALILSFPISLVAMPVGLIVLSPIAYIAFTIYLITSTLSEDEITANVAVASYAIPLATLPLSFILANAIVAGPFMAGYFVCHLFNPGKYS